jgi:hypothetical protein
MVMNNIEKPKKKVCAFNLLQDTFTLIEAHAEAEMGGNTSKWVQAEFDKIFAARAKAKELPNE